MVASKSRADLVFGQGDDPRRKRIRFLVQSGIALLAAFTFALLPDSNFVREAYNASLDWLGSHRPAENAKDVLGRPVVFVRVLDGTLSRTFPMAQANWKDPAIVLDRDHVADLIERLSDLDAFAVVVLTDFPRTPAVGQPTDKLAGVIQKTASSKGGPRLLFVRRARPYISADIPASAIGYSDAPFGACLQQLQYDEAFERGASTPSGRIDIRPLLVTSEKEIVRYVSPVAAVCDSSAPKPQTLWTLSAALAQLGTYLPPGPTATQAPADCAGLPNTPHCLAIAAGQPGSSATGLAPLDAMRIEPRRALAPSLVATGVLEIPPTKEASSMVRGAIVVLEVGPNVAGNPTRTTGSGPQSFGQIILAGAVAHAAPSKSPSPSQLARLSVLTLSALLACGVSSFLGNFALAAMAAGAGALALTGLGAALLHPAFIADVGVGTACAAVGGGFVDIGKRVWQGIALAKKWRLRVRK